MSATDHSLTEEIRNLEIIIEKKKRALFLLRLSKMYEASLSDVISNISIEVDRNEKTWCITYTHITDEYSVDNYSNETYIERETDELDDNLSHLPLEEIPVEKNKKISVISFGKNKKYFIKGGIKFSIYRNSANELRIINPNYDFELDLDEQKYLVTEYSRNKHIPECLALSIFLYMSYNKWDDTAIVNHFSLV
jgi:hypothetical protein